MTNSLDFKIPTFFFIDMKVLFSFHVQQDMVKYGEELEIPTEAGSTRQLRELI